MAVNISARKYAVSIIRLGETEGLDVTAACSSTSGGYLSITEESVGEDGLITVRGTLVLQANTPGIDEILHPWQNPARFAPENVVSIKVADSSGVLRYHCKSGLLIRKMPPPCAKNNWMVKIELGCSLTMRNYRQPDEDASQGRGNVGHDRGDIIKSVLSKVGLKFNTSCPGYELSYPIPKTGGSFVEQAGAVAVGALYALYSTPAEIRAKRIALNAQTPFLRRVIGTNEVDFEPLEGTETPCELVRCVGVGYTISNVNRSGQSRSEEFAPAETVQEGAGAKKVLVGWRLETWGWSGNTFVREIQRSAARGLLISNGFFEELGIDPPGNPFNVIPADTRVEKSIYETGAEGRLVRKELTSRQPIGSFLQDYYRNNPPDGQSVLWTSLSAAEDQFVEYSYSSGSNTSRIESYKNEPRGKIAGSADNWGDLANPNPTGLAASEIDIQTWAEQNEGEWRIAAHDSAIGTSENRVGGSSTWVSDST